MKSKPLFLALLLAGLSSHALASTADKLLSYAVTGIFQPRAEQLAVSSARLAANARTACTKASDFAALRQDWQQSYLAWKQLAALNWGPGASMRISRVIAFHPVRPTLLEDAITQSASGEKKYEEIGAAAKGLAAIEYLLYGAPALQAGPRCQWLQQLTDEVASQSRELAGSWQAIAADVQQGKASAQLPEAPLALEELYNLSLAGSNELLKELSKLDGSKPDSLTGYRSALGRELMRAQFSQIQALMLGGNNGAGIVSLLQTKQPKLADKLARQVLAVDKGLQALPAQLAEAKGREKTAIVALQALLDLLEGEVATALDLTLSFNESDGD